MATQRNDIGHQDEIIATEETPLNADEQTEVKVKRTFRENVIYFFQNVTLEPTVMLYIIGYMITNLTTTNLSLEKACRVNLNFTDEICTAMRQQELESQNPYEREAQRLLASAVAWKTYITATVPCIIGLFVGPWSDKTGHRKIFLVIPLIGQILGCVNNILHTFFFYQLNLEALVFSEAVIEALSGGMAVMIITIFSFIAAVTTTETRTFRMGMVNFSLTVGFPIGIASSGFILRHLGYYGSYGIAMGIHIINMLYNTFVLKDPKRTSEHKMVSSFTCFNLIRFI